MNKKRQIALQNLAKIKKRTGRPSLGGKTIVVRGIADNTMQRIREYAEERNMTVSEVIRYFLELQSKT